MYCTKCGNMVSETSKFCPKCGTAVQAAAPSQPQPQQQPPLNSASAVSVKKQNKNKMIGILFVVGILVLGVLLIAVFFHKPNPTGPDTPISGGDGGGFTPFSISQTCTHCNGSGKVTCTTCNGTGKWKTKIVVPNYGGNDYGTKYETKDCPYCDNGKKDCPYCGGDGEI